MKKNLDFYMKKMSLLRLLKHQKYKLFRLKDPPESISIGLAWGAAVSFTPLLGLHIIICFIGTILMRGNLLAATAGTVIGNPWTFPFIFYICYRLGILFYPGTSVDFELKVSYFTDNFTNLFIPTLIGSIPISILTWFVVYNISKSILKRRLK